jgi:ATP-binding cassette subfamily C (CFTR/MRP) protein 1
MTASTTHDHHEGDLAPADPAGAVQNTTHEEPLDDDNEEKDAREKDFVDTTSDADLSVNNGSEPSGTENEKRMAVDRTKSHATDITTDSHADHPAEKLPWHKRINPLRWGGVPPIPEKRGVSREYSASFLSLVYFQWMAPIMTVC